MVILRGLGATPGMRTSGVHGVAVLVATDDTVDGHAGANPWHSTGCNANSPSRPAVAPARLSVCLTLLLFHDPRIAATEPAAGALGCPHRGCRHRPPGHPRPRQVRVGADRTEAHGPAGRAAGPVAGPVPGVAASYPQRADTVDTVGAARFAATSGLDYRRAAAHVAFPLRTLRVCSPPRRSPAPTT